MESERLNYDKLESSIFTRGKECIVTQTVCLYLFFLCKLIKAKVSSLWLKRGFVGLLCKNYSHVGWLLHVLFYCLKYVQWGGIGVCRGFAEILDREASFLQPLSDKCQLRGMVILVNTDYNFVEKFVGDYSLKLCNSHFLWLWSHALHNVDICMM